MIFCRSMGALAFQTLKPSADAAMARSRSSFEACGTAASTSSVAGFSTSSVTPPEPWRNSPFIKSSSFS